MTNTQVTAFGETSASCQLSDVWSTARSDVVAPVACFRPGGVAEPGVFFAAYATGD